MAINPIGSFGYGGSSPFGTAAAGRRQRRELDLYAGTASALNRGGGGLGFQADIGDLYKQPGARPVYNPTGWRITSTLGDRTPNEQGLRKYAQAEFNLPQNVYNRAFAERGQDINQYGKDALAQSRFDKNAITAEKNEATIIQDMLDEQGRTQRAAIDDERKRQQHKDKEDRMEKQFGLIFGQTNSRDANNLAAKYQGQLAHLQGQLANALGQANRDVITESMKEYAELAEAARNRARQLPTEPLPEGTTPPAVKPNATPAPTGSALGEAIMSGGRAAITTLPAPANIPGGVTPLPVATPSVSALTPLASQPTPNVFYQGTGNDVPVLPEPIPSMGMGERALLDKTEPIDTGPPALHKAEANQILNDIIAKFPWIPPDEIRRRFHEMAVSSGRIPDMERPIAADYNELFNLMGSPVTNSVWRQPDNPQLHRSSPFRGY